MKNYIFFLVGFLIFNTSIAQVSIGSSVSPTNLYVSKIKEAEFDYLKNAETYFVVPEELEFNKTKKLISSIWTFNEMKFIRHDQYNEDDYVVANKTIIRIDNTAYTQTKTSVEKGTRTIGSWLVYKFEMISYPSVRINKKGKKDPEIFRVADVFFTPNIAEEPKYYNFNYGFIKNFFQTLNDKLTNKEQLNVRDGIVNEGKIGQLKTQTLYVPDRVLKMVNMLNGKVGTRTPDELFDKYQYPYEMISATDLNDKIISGEKFYYLMYNQFNEYKLLSIIDSETGEMIYLVEYKGYKLKSSDMKIINKTISKN